MERMSSTLSIEEFAAVVHRHQAGVCAAAYGVTGDRALSEDITQETFLAAWRGMSTLRDPAKLGEWLRGIARNLAHKARRRVAEVASDELEEVIAGADPARDAVANDEVRVVGAAVRTLPEAYREALILYYWGDQSAKQVAEALGITEATAMQRLSRGRALLRDEVERRVDGTLRRARPGTALTAAILAAVAATLAGEGAALAATRGAQASGVSRRVIWKAGLSLASLPILGVFGASSGWSARSRRRRPASTAPAATATPTTVSSDPPRTDTRQVQSSSAHADRNAPVGDDDPQPSMSIVVTGEADWIEGAVAAAMSTCFVDELIDQSCGIQVEVRDGTISGTRIEPFEGASRRVLVRTLDEVPTTLSPSELESWLAANRLISANLGGRAELTDERAIEIGELVALCARARLEGQAIHGADGTYQMWFHWQQDRKRQIDRQAYGDLGVETGESGGPASAAVTIVSFLDVACPWFAGKTLAALREVLARYPDDVRLVVKLCPIDPERELASEAVYAAGAQGAFWPMLERIALDPGRAALDDLVGHAAMLGLDAPRLRADLTQRAFRDAVARDQEQADAMGIDGRPSAIFGGRRRVHGALPSDVYAEVVDALLGEAPIAASGGG